MKCPYCDEEIDELDIRELFISGICSRCWDELFG